MLTWLISSSLPLVFYFCLKRVQIYGPSRERVTMVKCRLTYLQLYIVNSAWMLYLSCVPSASSPLRVLHSSAAMSSNQSSICRAPPPSSHRVSQFYLPICFPDRRDPAAGREGRVTAIVQADHVSGLPLAGKDSWFSGDGNHFQGWKTSHLFFPPDTRRCFDVESTSETLIQRRNNVVQQRRVPGGKFGPASGIGWSIVWHDCSSPEH